MPIYATPTGWPGEQLVEAAKEGDKASIAALVSGSHPHVQRFARTLCGSPQDAEDAAQEALIILYRQIGTLRASAALASWMFRIVRHECLRRARLSRRSAHIRITNTVDDVVASAEDDVLAQLEVHLVAAAVAALPLDQRRVLIMRDVQGYSGLATATALGLSTAAMKSRLHRARAAMQHLLDEPPALP